MKLPQWQLETGIAEDEAAAASAEQETTTVRAFTRAKLARAPLPAHLPRERVVLPGPTACPCCGGKLSKLGETITNLLADILHGKFCEHQPLNRQSESFARHDIDLSVSTLAGWVGTCTATLCPLVTLIRAHVFAAAHPRRRQDRSGAGQTWDCHRTIMDLCARRSSFRGP